MEIGVIVNFILIFFCAQKLR